MLLLTSTSDLVQIITASAGTINVHASWIDNAAGTITPGRTNTPTITGAATTTTIAAPLTAVQRNVKMMSIRNEHATTSNLITVQHTDGTNVETIWKGTLLASEEVVLDAEGRWTYYAASGAPKLSPAVGLFISATVKTSGTSHTVSASTNTIRVRLVAGGGGGGNSTGNATQTAVAGGGGAGGYAEKWFTVTPNTAYTYAVGGGGAAGAAGTNSTFAVGATTVTAIGGSAGVGAVTQTNATVFHIPGGAGGTVSTNGDINSSGAPGLPGMRAPGTAATAANTFHSGGGGSSALGSGGVGSGTAANGAAGAGYGGGGAGGLSNTTGANNGGIGAAGVVIIEEFS